jgi:hypothetical protein
MVREHWGPWAHSHVEECRYAVCNQEGREQEGQDTPDLVTCSHPHKQPVSVRCRDEQMSCQDSHEHPWLKTGKAARGHKSSHVGGSCLRSWPTRPPAHPPTTVDEAQGPAALVQGHPALDDGLQEVGVAKAYARNISCTGGQKQLRHLKHGLLADAVNEVVCNPAAVLQGPGEGLCIMAAVC